MEGKRGFRYNELWGNTKRGVGKMEKRDKNISYLRFVITYNIVLLIPLLIVSFSVFYMVHSITGKSWTRLRCRRNGRRIISNSR